MLSVVCPAACFRRLGWRYWHPTRGSPPHVHHHEARAWVEQVWKLVPTFIHTGGFHQWGIHKMDGLFHRESQSGWFRGTPILGNPHMNTASRRDHEKTARRAQAGKTSKCFPSPKPHASSCGRVWSIAKPVFHSTFFQSCFSAFVVLSSGQHFGMWLFGNPTPYSVFWRVTVPHLTSLY